jgi:hypothetical protein
MSQKTRKSADRPATARARPAGTLFGVALKGSAQPAKPKRCAVARTAAQRPASWESRRAYRRSGSASEVSIPALRRGAELPCSTRQGKQQRELRIRRSAAAARAPSDLGRRLADELQRKSNRST